MRQNVRFQTAGGGKAVFPPPEISWFGWCYEKMTINKVVQNHQVNQLGTNQIEHKTKTVQIMFVKKVPQMKIWWKLIHSETHIIVANALTSWVYFIFTLNDSFNFFNILLDVAFEIFQKPKNLWVLKETLHVNTERIHNTRFNTSKSKKKDCQNMLQV